MKRYIKASRGNALVGIWGYTEDGNIWDVSVPTDSGELDGMYIQFSSTKNHMNMWSSVVKDNVKDSAAQKEFISKGYRSLERGRVIYNCATACYEVTCSAEIIKDESFRRKIIECFNLSNNRVEFVVLNHYVKEELTGNPELDRFMYEGNY